MKHLSGETSIDRDKTRVTEAHTNVLIDGTTYRKVYFRIYTGQVMTAHVDHIKFTPKIRKELSEWWYRVNFVDAEYKVRKEFIL